MTGKPVVLFACVHNSGRSLAAKVLAEHHARGRVQVHSAGSEPGEALNPLVVEVLHERGLSTHGETPTLLTPLSVQDADVVVTMGCGESCPVITGRTYEDWPLDDPKGQSLDAVRRIVSEVEQHVIELLARLGEAPGRGWRDSGGRASATSGGVDIQLAGCSHLLTATALSPPTALSAHPRERDWLRWLDAPEAAP
jgi:arsenate reductase